MKVLILILPIFLSGCFATTVPVSQKFPEAPPILLENCPQLLLIPEEKNNIRDMTAVVIQNYGMYYQCQEKVKGWQEWYNETTKIMNGKKYLVMQIEDGQVEIYISN
jgi:hypothetical protein